MNLSQSVPAEQVPEGYGCQRAALPFELCTEHRVPGSFWKSPPSPVFRPPHRTARRAPGVSTLVLQSRRSRALGCHFPLQKVSAIAQLTFLQASGPVSTSLSQCRCQQSEGHRRVGAHNASTRLPPPHPAALHQKPSSAFWSLRKPGCRSRRVRLSQCHHPGSQARGGGEKCSGRVKKVKCPLHGGTGPGTFATGYARCGGGLVLAKEGTLRPGGRAGVAAAG